MSLNGDNRLSILIQAKIDEASTDTMQKQLDTLSKNLKAVKISLDLGDIEGQFVKLTKEIQKESSKMFVNEGIKVEGVDKTKKSIQELRKESEKAFKELDKLGEVKGVKNMVVDTKTGAKSFQAEITSIKDGMEYIQKVNVFGKLNQDTKEWDFALEKAGSSMKKVLSSFNYNDYTANINKYFKEYQKGFMTVEDYHKKLQILMKSGNADYQMSILPDDVRKTMGSHYTDIETKAIAHKKRMEEFEKRNASFGSLDDSITTIQKVGTEVDVVFNKMKKLGEVKDFKQTFDTDGNLTGYSAQIEEIQGNLKILQNYNVIGRHNEETKQWEYSLDKVSSSVKEVNKLLGSTDFAKSIGKTIESQKKGVISLEEAYERLNAQIYKKDGTLTSHFGKMDSSVKDQLLGDYEKIQKQIIKQEQDKYKKMDALHLQALQENHKRAIQAQDKLDAEAKKAREEQLKQEAWKLKEEWKMAQNHHEKMKALNDKVGEKQSTADTRINNVQYDLRGFIDESELERIRAGFKSINTENAGTEADIDRINAEVSQWSEALNEVIIKAQRVKKEQEELGTLMAKDVQRQIALDDKKEASMKRIQQLKQAGSNVDSGELSKLERELGQIDARSVDADRSIRRVNQGLSDLEKEAKRSASQVNSLGGVLKKALAMYSLYDVMQLGKQAVRGMVTQVAELDRTLVELQKVSDLSGDSLDAFTKKAFNVANGVGQLGSDVVQATADFKKMGYTVEESLKLAENAMLYTNVGDNVSPEEATKTLISSMKAFNIEATDSVSIIDKINSVSNNFAISSEGLGSALQSSASSLMEANNSLDQTLALYAVGNQITQDPDKVSNGLRTISMRLRGVNEETGDLIPKFREMFMEYTNGQVDIMNNNNEFKSTFEIIRDLGKHWKNLTDIQRAHLAELSAGKNRANIFMSLMNSAEDLDKAVNVSMDSMGSSMAENNKYMDSIAGKMNQLKSAVQNLSITTISSDFIKGLVDMTTGVVRFLDSIGGLVPVLGTAIGLLITFKAQMIATSLASFASSVGSIVSVVMNLGQALLSPIALFKNLSTAVSMAGLSMDTLRTGGIGLLVVALSGLAMASAKVKQKQEELRQETEAHAQKNAQALDSVKGLKEQYEQLNSIQDKDNATRKALLDVQSQIIQALGMEGDALDLVNGKYEDNIKVIEQHTRAKLDSLKLFQEEAVKDARESLDEEMSKGFTIKNFGIQTEGLKEAFDQIANDFESFSKTKGKDFDLFQINTDNIDEANTVYYELIESMKRFGAENSSTYDAVMESYREFLSKTEELNTKQNDLNKTKSDMFMHDQLAEQGITDVTKATDYQIKSIKDQAKAFADGDKALANFIETVMYNTFPQLKADIDGADGATGRYGVSLKELADSMEKTINEIGTLDDAINTLSSGKQLSGEAIVDLSNKYPQLRDQLIKTKDGYTINKEALIKLRNQIVDTEKQSIQSQINDTRATIENTRARIGSYKNEIGALKTLAQAKSALAKTASTPIKLEEKNKVPTKMDLFNKAKDPSLKLKNPVEIDKSKIEQERKELQELIGLYETLDKLENSMQDLDVSSHNSYISATTPSSSSRGGEDRKDNQQYISNNLDILISDLLLKGDELAQAYEFTNAKLDNAIKKGDEKTAILLKDQLSGQMASRVKATSEMAKTLRSEGDKLISTLNSTGLFKGKDLKKLTEKQLEDVKRSIDIKIANATDSQSSSLNILKSKIEEYGNAIIRIYQDELPRLSQEWWVLENERIQKTIDSVDDRYNREEKQRTKLLREIELEQMLLTEGTEDYIKLEEKKYKILLERQTSAHEALRKLKEEDIDLESADAQRYLDILNDTEKEKRNMLKEFAKLKQDARKKELEDQKEALEENKKGLETLLDMTMKMLKQEAEAKKKAIKDELDGYKKIIDAKKQSLKEEKNERDHEKNLKEKQSSIKKVEDKILELSNDNSAKAISEKRKLEEELIKLKEDLADYQYEHSLEKQEEALDKEYDAFEAEKNKELDKIEDYLSKEGNLRAEAIKLIESKNKDLYEKLIKWNREYSTGIDADVTNAWDTAYNAMELYNGGQMNVLNTLENIAQKMKKVNEEIKTMNSLSGVTIPNDWVTGGGVQDNPNGSANKPQGDEYQKLIDEIAPKMNRNSDDWKKTDDPKEKKRLSDENERMAKQIGAWKGSDGDWWVSKKNMGDFKLKDLYPEYHTGGIVGNQPNLKSTEEFAKLLKGEVVSTEKDVERFMKTTMPNIASQTIKGGMDMNIEKFIDITVQGNLDNSVDIESIIKRASSKALDNLVNAISNKGVKQRIGFI